MNWEFDINRYKLLCKNQICKIQLYSTDNYSRYNKIMMEKNMKKNIYVCMCIYWASLVTQLVKNLPAMWETWVRSLNQEDPLEKGMAIHSSILAWRIPWTVQLPWGRKESGMTE